MMYYGLSYRQLLDSGNSSDDLAPIAARYKYARKLAQIVIRDRAGNVLWRKFDKVGLEVDGYEFWMRLVRWTSSHRIDINKDADVPIYASNHEGCDFWNSILHDDYNRVTKDFAKRYGVVRIDAIAAPTMPRQHPLDFASMTFDEMNWLSFNIHGVRFEEALRDGAEANEARLHLHFIYSAALHMIIENFGIGTVELIADIMAVVDNQRPITPSTSREERLNAFLSKYYIFMRAQDHPLVDLAPKSMAEVPDEAAFDLAVKFLDHITYGGFLQHALRCFQGKLIVVNPGFYYVDIVQSRGTVFIARFVQDSYALVATDENMHYFRGYRCGRISWQNR